MLGIGAILAHLGGDQDSVAAYQSALNKRIATLELEEKALRLRFTDGTAVEFYDDGQSCCESRYMRSDDDPQAVVGTTFLRAEVKDAAPIHGGGEVHEVQFLDIVTDSGVFQVANHNEHNGYYGGIVCRVRAVK